MLLAQSRIAGRSTQTLTALSPTPMSPSMRRQPTILSSLAMLRPILFVVVAGLLSLIGSSGCSGEADVTEPEGGYAAFRAAMLARNPDAVWATLSDDTRQLFREVLATLEATDSMVDQLQPTDRQQAREAIGAELLDEIDEPRKLFAYIFAHENIPVEANFAAGLQARQIEQTSETRALVHTRGGQDVEMIRDEDGYWRVRSPLHELFASAFSAMETNRANLETAINLFGAATNEEEEIARLLGEPEDSGDEDESEE